MHPRQQKNKSGTADIFTLENHMHPRQQKNKSGTADIFTKVLL
jgi:hypothetical protein